VEQGISILDLKAAYKDTRELSSSEQVDDLLAKGYTLTDIVGAGYTKTAVTNANAGITETAYSNALTASASANGNSNNATNSTTIMIVVALLVVIAVIAGAIMYVNKSKTSGSTQQASFENPFYDAGGGSARGNPAYADPQTLAHDGAGGAGGAGGYMDVAPKEQGQPAMSSGYMDVAPTANGSGGGDVFAHGDDGSSDDEEV